MELKCSDLGVADCDFVAKGDTPGDIVEQMVKHLREEHHIDMPEPDKILENQWAESPVFKEDKEDIEVIVKRMRQALDIDADNEDTPPPPRFAVGPAPWV